MIELFYYPTPNGKKISIMLEELGLNYKINRVDIYKNEQFNSNFSKISPLNKIPVIKDQDTIIIESGAILIYLAEKNNFQFYPKKFRKEINEWLMVQVSFIGPMFGQLHFFKKFNPGSSKYSEDRYLEIVKKIYIYLDKKLSESKFIACDEYTIVDIGTFPWFCRHEWHNLGLKNYKNLYRWFSQIAERPAVIKGFDPENLGEKIPL